MPYLNGLYIHVLTEEFKGGAEISKHPIETGIPISDHTKRYPWELYLKGKIVGGDAWSTLSAIRQFAIKGQLVAYEGRNLLTNGNYLITDFESSHPNTNWGGCDFDMVLEEVQFAKTPYAPGSTITTQITKPDATKEEPVKKHIVKSGDTLWDIAKSYYGNGADFPKIVQANPIIKNPDVIQIGWELVIPA